MKYICTYFDYNFLSKGLALYHSIKRHNNDFILYILAFDNKTIDYLNNLGYQDIYPISFESYNEYFKTRPEKYKDRKQYYFSTTPNICLYIFEKFTNVDSLLYLDADVYVSNSLLPIYKEIGNASIAFCSHRFNPLYQLVTKNYGKYNVGVNFFRKSDVGLKCLSDWKADCDNWSPENPENQLDFFSDQIFLDKWPMKYPELVIIKNIGVNTAPWNVANYSIKFKQHSFWVDNTPLIIYHFSSLNKTGIAEWNGKTITYLASIKGPLLHLYKIYIQEVESFGMYNAIIHKLDRKKGFFKKSYNFFMKLLINETIVIDH